ncbi:MAG: hypothetical protein EHM20_17575 [Alphaproteobacteria bacterium]|nr:MAG: hypothetical protein EHM20_17575 [Alphaproteobacteria bacterium]
MSDSSSDSEIPVVTDTVDVQSKFLVGDEYKSHIKLDFAISKQKFHDTNNIKPIKDICAISVIPDTSWINSKQRSMPEDEWNTIVSDNQFYEQIAIDTLEKLDIPTLFAPREKRYIKFLKSNGKECFLDLGKMYNAWGLILFNGNDDPVLWSSTDIDNEIKEIYGK